MASHPRDRFDDVPDDLRRVGAHRAPRRRGRGWITFAWAALATGVLFVAGVFGLSRYDPSFSLDFFPGDPEPTATQTTDPVDEVPAITDPGLVDPALNLTIAVLNGSPNAGVQEAAGDQLAAIGWNVTSRLNASVRDEDATVVYYSGAEFEGVALGLVAQLGVGTIKLSEAFPGSSITVVLGADYVPPAG